jgi:hypothetical protein
MPLPAGPGPVPLEQGEYATSLFSPGFSFTVDQPVIFDAPEVGNAVALNLGTGDTTYLTFVSDSVTLFDPESEHTGAVPDSDTVLITSPESLTTWLAEHPRLDVSEPAEVTIGGQPAVEVTVEIAEGQGYESPTFCGPGIECVLLLGTPQFGYYAESGRRIRFQVLETGGRTLAILTEATVASYEDGVALADQLLATVEFQ